MTMQDVLEMMKCIREFFTVVRLESGYDTMDSEETYCEIEYLKEDIFFVKAKRIEIDLSLIHISTSRCHPVRWL